MKIPIRNLYHILCYGLSDFYAGGASAVSGPSVVHPLDLLSTMLVQETDKLVKRGLHLSYQEITSEDRSVKGRIDLGRSISSGAIARKSLVCVHDEIGCDPVLNGVIKSTLSLVARSGSISSNIRQAAGRLASRFPGHLEKNPVWRRELIRVERTFRHYALAIGICRLIRDSIMVDADGRVDFVDFVRNDAAMRAIFERFVRNLLRHKIGTGLTVRSRRFPFKSLDGEIGAVRFVPTMTADVVVESDEALVIIEVKYVPGARIVHHGNERLRSAHLYQLYSYLRNFPASPSKPVSGMLIYPALARASSVDFTVEGLPLAVGELNLESEWAHIERQLLDGARAALSRAGGSGLALH